MFHMGLLLMMTVADLSQASTPAKKAPPVAAKRAAIAPLTLPTTAVSSGPNQWTHADAQGSIRPPTLGVDIGCAYCDALRGYSARLHPFAQMLR